MEFENKVVFPEKEEAILAFWQKNKIFEESIRQRKAVGKIFYFYDGPPFATGLPHYGHILAGTIKDVVPRFRTMQGYYVERRFGWDCHGLPVEFEAEKELKLNGKTDIEQYGVAKFNEYCRSIVLRYAGEWRKNVQRMARWVDLERDYKTMDTNFMESIWFVFHSLWKKGLIYQSFKIVPYSPRLHTPLSNFEVNLGYRMVKDPSIVVKFPLADEKNSYFLSWTTTPWTLPANLSLTVAPEIDYAQIQVGEEFFILAKALIPQHFAGKDYRLVKEYKGKQLEFKRYLPVFPYAGKALGLENKDGKPGAFFVTLADYVEIETGTGIVQTAPMFGEDDFVTGKKYGLPEFLPFDDSGNFTNLVPEFAGLFFKEADPGVIESLKARGLLFHKNVLEHSYPFCWRSGVPLMYRAIPSWYVNVEKIKPVLLANNQKIHWVPGHIQSGRMGKWLENARDWAISRNRYWGNPIPIWNCEVCGEQICISSRAELEERINALRKEDPVQITDLHSHKIDMYPLACPKCQGKMHRTPEVLDCWFESGAMPYGQMHYPFENKAEFEQCFPADFISEGLDQTRGWFYTLLVLSAALFEVPAFKNCIVSGLILAEDGQKMSKSLKNYPDPELMINTYGADAIRMYMLSSGAMKAEELRFQAQGLSDTLRDLFLPVWNVLNFFITYSKNANISFERLHSEAEKSLGAPTKGDKEPKDSAAGESMDRWILSRLESLKSQVLKGLEAYNLSEAVGHFYVFVDELTNGYLRASRKRFQSTQQDLSPLQLGPFIALYQVLREFSLLIAPFAPYFAEMIFQVLQTKADKISVHLMDYPKVAPLRIDLELEAEIQQAFNIINLGLSLRAEKKLKLRQPLQKAVVFSNQPLHETADWLRELIKAELNVKELDFSSGGEEFLQWTILPNLPVLGKKIGNKLPALKEALQSIQITFADLRQIERGEKTVSVVLDGEAVELHNHEIIIRYQKLLGKVATSDGTITLALDTELSQALVEEGWVREFIRKVQTERKNLSLQVNDRVVLNLAASPALKKVLEGSSEQIAADCGIEKFHWQSPSEDSSGWVELSLGEENIHFQIGSITKGSEDATTRLYKDIEQFFNNKKAARKKLEAATKKDTEFIKIYMPNVVWETTNEFAKEKKERILQNDSGAKSKEKDKAPGGGVDLKDEDIAEIGRRITVKVKTARAKMEAEDKKQK